MLTRQPTIDPAPITSAAYSHPCQFETLSWFGRSAWSCVEHGPKDTATYHQPPSSAKFTHAVCLAIPLAVSVWPLCTWPRLVLLAATGSIPSRHHSTACSHLRLVGFPRAIHHRAEHGSNAETGYAVGPNIDGNQMKQPAKRGRSARSRGGQCIALGAQVHRGSAVRHVPAG